MAPAGSPAPFPEGMLKSPVSSPLYCSDPLLCCLRHLLVLCPCPPPPGVIRPRLSLAQASLQLRTYGSGLRLGSLLAWSACAHRRAGGFSSSSAGLTRVVPLLRQVVFVTCLYFFPLGFRPRCRRGFSLIFRLCCRLCCQLRAGFGTVSPADRDGYALAAVVP